MHVVIWTSKGQRYATPSSSVVEVVTMVESRHVPNSDDWLVGIFDFRGSLLPLIDSSMLLGRDASVIRMASRILVIRTSVDPDEDGDRVGLVVEQVLGSERLDFGERASCKTTNTSRYDFLGPIAMTPNSTVQLTIPSRIPTGRE